MQDFALTPLIFKNLLSFYFYYHCLGSNPQYLFSGLEKLTDNQWTYLSSLLPHSKTRFIHLKVVQMFHFFLKKFMAYSMWEFSSPTRDQTPAPCIDWECGVSTPGPPGKSQHRFYFYYETSSLFSLLKNNLLPTCYNTVIANFMHIPILKPLYMTPPSPWIILSQCHPMCSSLTCKDFAHMLSPLPELISQSQS